MRSFDSFFNDDQIIYYLSKVRAKVAKQRSKLHLYHMLTDEKKYNYHKPDPLKISEYQKRFLNDLMKLLPPRRKWIELDDFSRYKTKSGKKKARISTIDKNTMSIVRTINHYREKKPNEPFVIELNRFIIDIQDRIKRNDIDVFLPTIYPKPKKLKKLNELKDEEKNTCRPICLFDLKDRLILSFTNQFLTQLFDPFFQNCSLAFRATSAGKTPTHHDAVVEILKFKNKHKNKALWVAECDMQKFYDSVNHKVIEQYFFKLIEKVRKKNNINLSVPINIFKKYLQSYSFNTNALPLNDNDLFWKERKIVRGEFGWVEKEFKELNYYNRIPRWIRCVAKLFNCKRLNSYLERYACVISEERIGIPQGGALSGLIANIVLDYTDKKMLTTKAFYIRFCDDMILMHPEEKKCKDSIIRYKRSLEKLKLVPHPFSNKLLSDRKSVKKYLPPMSLVSFWKEKSKGPYKWDSFNDGGFPWIGFVGYEIHHEGFVRVRKSSLEKEYQKQIEIVGKLKKAIEVGKRVANGSITESAIHQLIGMSVGRVQIWNFDEVEHELCWKNGFKALVPNKYSIKQLKTLDRKRNKLYYDLIKELDENYTDDLPPKEKTKRQIISFDKPFSYYYHFVDRYSGEV